MNFSARLKGLLLSPAREWQQISRERHSFSRLCLQWLLPLGLMMTLAALLGLFLHDGLNALQARVSWQELLGWLSHGVVLVFCQALALALVLLLLVPFFGGERQWQRIFALSVYSLTGLQLGGMLQALLLPLRPLLFLLGASWSVYLLQSGLQILMNVQPARLRPFGILVVVGFLFLNTLMMPFMEPGRLHGMFMTGPAAVPIEAGDEADMASMLSAVEKVQRAGTKLDEAAIEAGSAVSRNDSLAEAQAASDAVAAMAATVAGGAERTPLSAALLKSWFPVSLLGMRRQTLVIEPVGGTASRAVRASASYFNEKGRSIELRVRDAGVVAGLLAPSEKDCPHARRRAARSETADTLGRSYFDEAGRQVSVTTWKAHSHVEIRFVLTNGVRLTAEADGISVEALETAVRALQLEVLEQK